MTPTQALRAAIDRAGKWNIDWSDDEMLQDLEQIMDDLEQGYVLVMDELHQDYQYVSGVAADTKCVLHEPIHKPYSV